jgi:hypothetical protein
MKTKTKKPNELTLGYGLSKNGINIVFTLYGKVIQECTPDEARSVARLLDEIADAASENWKNIL